MPIYSELYMRFYTDSENINSETIVPFKLITCGGETIVSELRKDDELYFASEKEEPEEK